MTFQKTFDRSAVLQFIREYKARNGGNSPSYREIQAGCEIGSTNTVALILRDLEQAGCIQMRPERSRSITLVGESHD